MRLLKQFAIALSPFILNAELVKIPEIQDPSVLLHSEVPQPIAVPEVPLILSVEIPAPKQEAPAAAKADEQKVSEGVPLQQTPVATKSEQSNPPPVIEVPAQGVPLQQTPVATKSEQPNPPPVIEMPVAATVQEPPSTSEEVNTPVTAPATVVSSECSSPFHKRHVDIRHTEAKGVGYQDGYTTLEGFGIYGVSSYFMPFIDLRGHIFNDGELAGNIGIGERTHIPSINHLFGLYLYYDVRQGNHHLTVNQLSPGIEILGKRMEYRINGYFPVGNRESRTYGLRFDRFKGNRMVIKKRKKFAMTGVDGEVGVHITQSTNHDVYAGFGPYYFTADPFSSWGGKTRWLWRYRDYISLEASYSYDQLFKNVFQGTVSFSYPFGPQFKRSGKNCPNSNDLALSRAAFAPYRFEIPVIKRKTYRQNAKNSATGRPLNVWFVNNTSSSLGTYESPFPTLAQAQAASGPNDMIYVFPGDGTSKGMNAGIVLKDGQTLYGSGRSHSYKTKQGSVVIPALSNNLPTLTNAGNIVTLANGNEVSGLNLFVTQVSASAIDGTSTILGTNINQNTISGSVDHNGVQIVGGGTLIVNNNQFAGSFSGSTRAIFIQNLEQIIDIQVLNNTTSGYFRGIEVTPFQNPSRSSGNVLIAGNNVSSFNQFGIAYTTGMNQGLIRLRNNTVINSTGGGASRAIAVILNEMPDAGTYLIEDNTVIATSIAGASTGIFFQINQPNGTRARVALNNNLVTVGSPVGSDGIFVNDLTSDVICIGFTDNQVRLQNSTSTGLTLAGGTGAINVTEFSNNLIPNIVSSGNVAFVDSQPCTP
jgi:hypothetical protein